MLGRQVACLAVAMGTDSMEGSGVSGLKLKQLVARHAEWVIRQAGQRSDILAGGKWWQNYPDALLPEKVC